MPDLHKLAGHEYGWRRVIKVTKVGPSSPGIVFPGIMYTHYRLDFECGHSDVRQGAESDAKQNCIAAVCPVCFEASKEDTDAK